jgi:thioredoxin reductase
MSEAANCVGQDVYIVGAANSAGQAAVYFARHARRASRASAKIRATREAI